MKVIISYSPPFSLRTLLGKCSKLLTHELSPHYERTKVIKSPSQPHSPPVHYYSMPRFDSLVSSSNCAYNATRLFMFCIVKVVLQLRFTFESIKRKASQAVETFGSNSDADNGNPNEGRDGKSKAIYGEDGNDFICVFNIQSSNLRLPSWVSKLCEPWLVLEHWHDFASGNVSQYN